MNTENILICRFCVEVHSRVWRRVEYKENDDTLKKVWVCEMCWNCSLADIPEEVLEYDPPEYVSDEDEDEDEDELCAFIYELALNEIKINK